MFSPLPCALFPGSFSLALKMGRLADALPLLGPLGCICVRRLYTYTRTCPTLRFRWPPGVIPLFRGPPS
jgi:hypothetical protein